MTSMRRRERAVEGREGLTAILNQCRVCRLGLRDADGPYIVPMSFGYQWDEEGLRLYVHCAQEGRKLDAIRRDSLVAFEMDCGYCLLPAETACGHSCAYQSVTGTATARIVQELSEKCAGLACLMRHQTGRDFAISPQAAAGVCVLCLEVRRISGKRHGSR